MRHDQDAAVAAATVADDARSALLADLLGRVAGCFPRRETRQCCGQMVSGLLMELEDHNCWTIAEAAGHRGPHRLQHFLSRAVWDDQHVADIASAWAAGHLDDGDAVLIVDETADEKSSGDAVGAARQYSGTVGGIALCQVAVTLTYATARGHALIGRALYLPERCAADEEHRELAGIPEEVLFASKPQLASALLDRAHALGIRAAFVAGDEVYGGRELRRGIRQHGMGYVLAVRANHVVTTGSGRTVTAAAAAVMIPARAWHRMRTGSGTKGTRHYDWAMLEVTSDDTPGGHDGGHSVLLVRRHRYTGQLSFYRCWTPGPVPLSRLITIASARWRIEEDHQLAKQSTGLDAGQVIRWKSWHRWTALCLLAYIYLAVAVALQREQDASSDPDTGLIPITVPELLRLLRGTVIPPPRRDRPHRLHWSAWRRRHQHRDRRCRQHERLHRDPHTGRDDTRMRGDRPDPAPWCAVCPGILEPDGVRLHVPKLQLSARRAVAERRNDSLYRERPWRQFVIEDTYWTEDDYVDAIGQAGLAVTTIDYPRPRDPATWSTDEASVPPCIVIEARKAA